MWREEAWKNLEKKQRKPNKPQKQQTMSWSSQKNLEENSLTMATIGKQQG